VRAVVAGKPFSEWGDSEKDQLPKVAELLDMWCKTTEMGGGAADLEFAASLGDLAGYTSDNSLSGGNAGGGKKSAGLERDIAMEATSAASRRRPRTTTTTTTSSSSSSSLARSPPKPQLFLDSPVKGKRQVKQTRVFGSTPEKASSVPCGTGFHCPVADCPGTCAYDAKKCDECGAKVKYEPGMGAVLIKQRDQVTAPTTRKLPARAGKRKSAAGPKAKKKKSKKPPPPPTQDSEEEEEESEEEEEESEEEGSSEEEEEEEQFEYMPEPPRFKALPVNKKLARESLDSDSDTDDEEEAKIYKKTLRERKLMAERERREAEEHRLAYEHEEANLAFFYGGIRPSPKRARRQEEVRKFVEGAVVLVQECEEESMGIHKRCDNADICRFCNNYYGEDITNFDNQFERPTSMPGVRKIVESGKQRTSKKRKIVDAKFAQRYNSGWLVGAQS
jgi:hypothetical protein